MTVNLFEIPLNVIKATINNLLSTRRDLAEQLLAIDSKVEGLREAIDVIERNDVPVNAKRKYTSREGMK